MKATLDFLNIACQTVPSIKEGKQRQDSIDQFTAAGRTDLADKEAAELVILKEYLPQPLSAEELAL
jgi:uncharacterized protein YqeY